MVIKNFDVKNQYIIEYGCKVIFQSYDTIMFTYDVVDKTIYFNEYEHNYTKTTCKYLGLALQYLSEMIDYNSTWLNACLKSQNRKRFILSSDIEKGVDLCD